MNAWRPNSSAYTMRRDALIFGRYAHVPLSQALTFDGFSLVDWYKTKRRLEMKKRLWSDREVSDKESKMAPKVKRTRIRGLPKDWFTSVWNESYCLSDQFLDPTCTKHHARQFRNRFRLPLSAMRAHIQRAPETGFQPFFCDWVCLRLKDIALALAIPKARLRLVQASTRYVQ